MVTHLQMELDLAKEKIFQMADRSIEAMEQAITALKNLDAYLSYSVIKNDSVIDTLEKEIDEDCVKILVTRQPAASDLRLVLAMLKINTDIERIGDLAVNIAKETLLLCGKPHIKALIDIPRMNQVLIEMIKGTLSALSSMDTKTAEAVIQKDKEIDELNRQVFRELFTIMAENPSHISQAFSLIVIARLLERAGDHATNIAERVIFYIDGVDIRHCSKGGDDESQTSGS